MHPPRNQKATNNLSNIPQLDGGISFENETIESETVLDDTNETMYNTQDEIDVDTTPINIEPPIRPSKRHLRICQASTLPLVAVLNARSLYNKPTNFKQLLTELGLELITVAESWEREELSLENLLKLESYKIHSYVRPKKKAKKQPGGSCAII